MFAKDGKPITHMIIPGAAISATTAASGRINGYTIAWTKFSDCVSNSGDYP
jgi:hypothetical protein